MRKLLIALVILAGLAVVGDRVAEHYAEDQVASVVKERENLSTQPNVEFHGFPFVTQVLDNDLTEVTMTLPEVKPDVGDTERIRVEDVKVTFFHVRTSRNFRQATAEKMTGSATIPYSSVSALGPFTASYGGQGGGSDAGVGVITLEPDADQGLPDGLSLDIGVAVNDGAFTFLGTDGTTKIAPIPGDLEPLLSTMVQTPHQLYGLPKSFTIDSLQVTRDGIELKLSGTGVELTR